VAATAVAFAIVPRGVDMLTLAFVVPDLLVRQWQHVTVHVAAFARNLPNQDATAEFNRRLAKRFPAGSSEADLVDELRREKFSCCQHNPRNGERIALSPYPSGIFVQVRLVVAWKADADGRITDIRGDVQLTGL
jgi:hypothetical protein